MRPKSVGVEVCVVAADRAGEFQGAQPAVGRGEVQADSLGQFGDCQRAKLKCSPSRARSGRSWPQGSRR